MAEILVAFRATPGKPVIGADGMRRRRARVANRGSSMSKLA